MGMMVSEAGSVMDRSGSDADGIGVARADRSDIEHRAQRRIRWRERLLASAATLLPGRGAAVRRFDGAPVLLYHRVVEDGPPPDPFTVSLEAFEQQVAWLADHFELVTAGQLAARVSVGAPLDGVAAITFDDGDPSVVEQAWPVLTAQATPATVFVDAGRLVDGNRGCMSPDDLRILVAGGVEVASHGLSHVDLRKLPDATLPRELVRSREILADAVGQSVSGFAYPYGAHDDRVARLVHEAGYAYACTCRQHRSVRAGDDPFRLCRLEITAKDDMSRFRRKVTGAYAHVYAAWYSLNPSMRAWLDE